MELPKFCIRCIGGSNINIEGTKFLSFGNIIPETLEGQSGLRRTWTHIESLELYHLLFGFRWLDLSCPVFGLVFELVANWKWLVATSRAGEP